MIDVDRKMYSTNDKFSTNTADVTLMDNQLHQIWVTIVRINIRAGHLRGLLW